MYEVRWINLEYFFFKIYDFFHRVFGGGSAGYDSSVGGRSFWEWLVDFFGNTLSFVWVFVVIACIVLFAMVIYVRLNIYDLDQQRKQKYTDHFITPTPPPVEQKNPRWEHIEKLFASPNQNDWRTAIMEADIMLDELVQSLHFAGENLGERLKNANVRVLPTLQSAWEAHKMRNRIAHEGVAFHITERDAQLTKRHFEFVFRDMGVI